MADTLSYSINVKDNFVTTLNKLSASIQKVDSQFSKLSTTLDNNTNKISSNIDRLTMKLNLMGMTTSNSINHINNLMGSQFENVQKQQEKSVSDIEKRYQQMVKNIKNDLNGLNDLNKTNLGEKNNSQNIKNSKEDDSFKWGGLDNVLKSVMGGNFTSILGKLGVIGSIGTGLLTASKLLDSTMNSGFDILNKTTGNLFSAEGIQDSLQDAMGFETGRQKLDLFYGKEEGQREYGVATELANQTYASESDTIDIISKLGQVGIKVDEDQLRNLIDVAGTRPSVGTEHIGLAMQEAVDGRVAMLKLYGINNAKLQDYYKDLKKSDPSQYKELKGALNKKGTAGDPQKYFNLVSSFIEQSPMNEYAETYVQTLQGKLERLTGLFSKAKAEIMGIETDTGIARKGSLFDELGKSVDALKTKMEEPKTIDFMQKMSEAFGSVASGVSEAFTKLTDGIDLDKVVESINKVADVLSDSLNQLIQSGVLDEFIEKFPIMVEKILRYKSIELETEAKSTMEKSEGKFVQAGVTSVAGWDKKTGNYLFGEGYDNFLNKRDEIWEKGTGWINNIFKTNTELPVSDAQISKMIDKNNSMSESDKNSVKNYLKDDGVSSYNIATVNVYTDNPQDFINQLKQSASNRK